MSNFFFFSPVRLENLGLLMMKRKKASWEMQGGAFF